MPYIFSIFLSIMLFSSQVIAGQKLSLPDKNTEFAKLIDYVKERAQKHKINQDTTERLIAGIRADDVIKNKAIISDKTQPEKTVVSLEDYLKSRLPQSKKKSGEAMIKLVNPLISNIALDYSVEKEIIVALWGVESYFGQRMGEKPMVQSLLSLIYDGRRHEFFLTELLTLMKLVDNKEISDDNLYGSWAGAMGGAQFMPSSFERYAVDYDRDGKKDIWRSQPDTLASIANYLHKSGWQQGSPYFVSVYLPNGFDRSLLGRSNFRPVSTWMDLGVEILTCRERVATQEISAAIIEVDSVLGPKPIMIFNNYNILMKWNRSNYFATSTAIFADFLGKYDNCWG